MLLSEKAPYKTIRFAPKGGGTGTNGQSLTNGLSIDCSRYMTDILEINIVEEWVRVQPGVVLDTLNAALKPLGHFFAPSVAPSIVCAATSAMCYETIGTHGAIVDANASHPKPALISAQPRLIRTP